ncbi:hypothetical protein ACQR1I_26685 [Bradyrhizobium sp. HKCCYLS2038]|uniref:hypothetical protein n=1 Tax=unclassified Bradyrhizobium TaxID=2631580 RepID=UPI003EB7860B
MIPHRLDRHGRDLCEHLAAGSVLTLVFDALLRTLTEMTPLTRRGNHGTGIAPRWVETS